MESREIWKSITGFEGLYLISNRGNIKSLARVVDRGDKGSYLRNEKDLSLSLNKDGYIKVCLQKEGVRTHTNVHILVAKEFIPNPEDLPEVNHKDGNKSNNIISNLEWCTKKFNRQHAYDTGLQKAPKGVKHYKAKLSKKEVIEIRKSKEKGVVLAKAYNVSPQTISRVKLNKSYKDEI